MKIRIYNSLNECIGNEEGEDTIRILFKKPIQCNANNESFELRFEIKCD